MKSYVSMEQKLCPVCGETHGTNAILLDRRLRPSMERDTVTGYALCLKCQKLKDDGFIALIVCKNQPTKLEEADRTGEIIHLKKSVCDKMFNIPMTKELAFID